MKIKNQTHWRTDDLRKIISRIAADELDVKHRKHLVVRIVYRRKSESDYCTGCAWIRGRLAVIRVPSKHSARWRHDFCVVVAHELAHIRGTDGERWMRRSVRLGRPKTAEERERQRAFYAWAQAIEIRSTRDRVKPDPQPQPEPEPVAQPEPVVDPKVEAARLRAERLALLIQRRAAKAERMLAQWLKRKKMAERKVREYRKRVQYYAKRKAQPVEDQQAAPVMAALQ